MSNLPKAKLTKMQLVELAAVKAGAQDAQGSVVLKSAVDRSEANVRVQKKSALTTSAAGHTHLLYGVDDAMAGTTSYESTYVAGEPRDHYTGHCHPWLRGEDGAITVGEAMGHTHAIDALSVMLEKSAEGNSTAAPVVSTVTDMDLETLKKQLAAAIAFGALTDAEKAHHNALPEHERETFVGKSATDRAAVVKAAHEVVYTCSDGTVVLKSHGDLALSQAKRADKAIELANVEKAARELTELKKRATETLGMFPGDEGGAVALLKAAEGISDEKLRGEAVQALKAANAAFVQLAKASGVSDGAGEAKSVDAEKAFYDGVATYADKHKIADHGLALEKFLGTTEGLALKRKYDATRAYGH